MVTTLSNKRFVLVTDAGFNDIDGEDVGNIGVYVQIFAVAIDSDNDGVLDDGDSSGTIGDTLCITGQTQNCDDNSINVPNGPLLGTCTAGDSPGSLCTDNTDCGLGGFCSTDQEDADEDGEGDAGDSCPEDSGKIEPGICGCGAPDSDSDDDKILDCNDAYPNTAIEKGDLNNDNIVDIADAIRSLLISSGLEPSQLYMEAEANGDNRIGVEETIYILLLISRN